MNVSVSHHIDASDPDADGNYEYFYEYDIYRFSDGHRTLIARAYTDDSEKAAFLNFVEGGRSVFIDQSEQNYPLLVEAARYLAACGKKSFTRLTELNGYIALEDAYGLFPPTGEAHSCSL